MLTPSNFLNIFVNISVRSPAVSVYNVIEIINTTNFFLAEKCMQSACVTHMSDKC